MSRTCRHISESAQLRCSIPLSMQGGSYGWGHHSRAANRFHESYGGPPTIPTATTDSPARDAREAAASRPTRRERPDHHTGRRQAVRVGMGTRTPVSPSDTHRSSSGLSVFGTRSPVPAGTAI
jgi:hypothetical protein